MTPDKLKLKEVREIFISGKTLWRSYMNVYARQFELQAPVLDIGAGGIGTASYQRYIPHYGELPTYSLDLDPQCQPSAIADLQAPFPLATGSVKTVLACNVFQYFYRYQAVLSEIYRVLAPSGRVYITTSFFDRVASGGGDSLRLTGYALETVMRELGYQEIEVIACGTGACAAALDQVEFALPHLLRGVAAQIAWAVDKQLTKRSGGKYRNQHDYPLGYIVSARK